MIDAGEVLAGRYRLISQVGTGAMGVVWKARDELLHRIVAVKQLLHAGMSEFETEQAKRQALREGRITARLHHPHAITVYNVAEHAGTPYLIMEYLPARSLSTVLAERGPLAPAQVTRIGCQLAAALAAAHEAGIVHRDIKPGNVLLTDDGTAKITDFGVSRVVGDCTMTAAGMLAGTPAYLAPEVARGQEAGFPADVFSLGSTLYTAVEGVPPFGLDDNPLALLFRIANSEVTPPNKAGPLTSVLAELLERDVSRRPSMQQARHALTTAAAPPAFAVSAPPATANSLPTIRVCALPAPGPSAPVPRPPKTSALPVAGVQAREAPTPRSLIENATQPRHPAATILAVVASLLVAATTLGITLIYDGSNTTGTAVSPPSTAPGTTQNLQAPQPLPTAAAPVLAPRAKPSLTHSPEPSPAPSLTPSSQPSPAPSLTPSSQPSPAPSSPSNLEPSPPPSLEPSPQPSLEPSPPPGLEPSPPPSLEPSPPPSLEPSMEPTAEPTLEPTPTATA